MNNIILFIWILGISGLLGILIIAICIIMICREEIKELNLPKRKCNFFDKIKQKINKTTKKVF